MTMIVYLDKIKINATIEIKLIQIISTKLYYTAPHSSCHLAGSYLSRFMGRDNRVETRGFCNCCCC